MATEFGEGGATDTSFITDDRGSTPEEPVGKVYSIYSYIGLASTPHVCVVPTFIFCDA